MDPQRLFYASKPLKEFFHDIPAHEVGAEECRRYAKWRKKSDGTIRREIGLLGAALRMGGFQPKIWLPPKPPSKQSFLSKDQAQNLISEMTAHIQLFTRIGLATGQRKTAILNLTWDRVDFDRKIIDFNEPGRRKTKKRRSITPIGSVLRSVLSQAHKIAMTDRVIEWNGKPVKDIKKGFNRASERAAVPWCTPHTLKHTAISWMAEAGYTIDQISDMTATDTETVKQVYRKFNPNYLRDMADHMDMEVFDGSQNDVQNVRLGKRRP